MKLDCERFIQYSNILIEDMVFLEKIKNYISGEPIENISDGIFEEIQETQQRIFSVREILINILKDMDDVVEEINYEG